MAKEEKFRKVLVPIYLELIKLFSGFDKQVVDPVTGNYDSDQDKFTCADMASFRDAGIHGLDLGLNVRESDDPPAYIKNHYALRLHVSLKDDEAVRKSRMVFNRILLQNGFHTTKDEEWPFYGLVKQVALKLGDGSSQWKVNKKWDIDIVNVKPDNREQSNELFGDRRRFGVIQPGISVGHKNRRSGTIGAIVSDGKEKLLLSAWHVLAHGGTRLGDRIIHPGVDDGGNVEKDWIGSLYLAPEPDLRGDAALAAIRKPQKMQRTINAAQLGLVDVNDIPIIPNEARMVTLDDLGKAVIKSGKATGVTAGIIEGMGIYFMDYILDDTLKRIPIEGFRVASIPLEMEDVGETVQKVADLSLGDPHEISAPGDSGAIWIIWDVVAEKWMGVGLHFEGEKNFAFKKEQAFACHLPRVKDKLDFDFLTGTTKKNDTPGSSSETVLSAVDNDNRCLYCGRSLPS